MMIDDGDDGGGDDDGGDGDSPSIGRIGVPWPFVVCISSLPSPTF